MNDREIKPKRRGDVRNVGLVFAGASIEFTIRRVLLEPMCAGLVHHATLPELVADVILRTGVDQTRELLLSLLREYGSVNLETERRQGASVAIWAEVKQQRQFRNGVLHRCEASAKGASATAVALAEFLLGDVLDRVLASIGLQADANRLVHEKP